MFLNGALFWFSMGILFVVIAAGLKAFADERGWRITWWKGLLAVVWYAIFALSFYAWGTLVGEGESRAGFKLFLLGLFVSVVLGVGLIRLLARDSSAG
jgi:hypothetical protein